MEWVSDGSYIPLVEVAKRTARSGATVSLAAKRLGLKPELKKFPGYRNVTLAVPVEEVGKVLATLNGMKRLTQKRRHGRPYAGRAAPPLREIVAAPGPKVVATVSGDEPENGHASWVDFQTLARRLGRMAKDLQVGHFEYSAGEGKVQIERTQFATIDL